MASYRQLIEYSSSRTPKQANFFQAVYITISTWVFTLYYSMKALWVVSTRKEFRNEMDKVIRQWANALVNLSKIKIRVVGDFNRQYVAGQPFMLMCNHSSAYDIPVSFLAIPGSVRMLAKKELFRIPLFGQAMKLSEFISIHRQDKNQAKKDLAFAKNKMEDGIILWVAPEGTRSTDGQLLPFKKGGFHLAIQTKAKIVPLAIKDIHLVLPTQSFRPNLYQTIEVRIGDAVDASQYSTDDRNKLRDDVKASLEDLLSPPLA